MHLGRFNAVVYDLANHFLSAKIVERISKCTICLDNFVGSRDSAYLNQFKLAYGELITSVEVSDPDLKQPYAFQVIEDLSVGWLLGDVFVAELEEVLSKKSFDTAGVSDELKLISKKSSEAISYINDINNAFIALDVEFERAVGGESEIGILLPRPIVGETLKDLAAEFGVFSKLFRAINELTGAADYDAKVRTISSSWWQFFVEVGPEQVAALIFSIERIVNLFKTNLEIKNLSAQLASNNMPDNIIRLIEDEVEKRVSAAIGDLSAEVREKHGRLDDVERMNEVENQVRVGLRHLAMRLNQGGHVEINVSLPKDEKEPVSGEDDQPPSAEQIENVAKHKARLEMLRDLRKKAFMVSSEVLTIDKNAPLLLSVGSEVLGDAVE